ncbi:MAG: oxidoreductase [Actinomycetota bacterium]
MTDPLLPLLDLAGVDDSVAQTREAVNNLLANRVLRRRSAEVSVESALRGAWASAWLAGTELALADVRSGAAAKDPVMQGALRAQSAIGALADTWTRAPRQVLARLHALAAADLVPDSALLGRPAAAPAVAARLDTLAAVLAQTSAPAIVVAGVVHGELLSLDAFPPVSGLVARVAVRLTLVQRGLDPKSLVVVEVGHRELGDSYPLALEAYRGGTSEGVALWLRHCADAVVEGAREASAICTALARG